MSLADGFSLNAPPDEFLENPFPFYEAMTRDAPVLAQPDGSYILSAYADLDRVYRDARLFSSDKKRAFAPKFSTSPLFEHHTTSLVFSDPPLHTRVRRTIVGAMTPRAIAGMEPRLIQMVDQLLDELGNQTSVDLVEDFAAKIPIEVIGNLFDMPVEDRAPLRDWSLAILGALEPTNTPEQLTAGNTAVTEFCAYLKDLTRHRRAHPGDPDIDVLTRLIEGGDLSEVELLQNCIFILNAGHETTTNLIANALAVLPEFPDQKTALIRNPDLLETGIDEFLRHQSPNQFGNREATEDCTISGTDIPAGTNLHLCIGAANRDPAQFEHPQALVLDRKPNKHFAFAGGPHTCAGFSLAKMEGRIAIGGFLDRFPNYRLTDRPTYGGRIRFRGFLHLPAKIA